MPDTVTVKGVLEDKHPAEAAQDKVRRPSPVLTPLVALVPVKLPK